MKKINILLVAIMLFLSGCTNEISNDDLNNQMINVDSHKEINDSSSFEVDAGNQILEVGITLNNTTNEEINYNSQYISAYDREGNEHIALMVPEEVSNNALIVGSLKPDETISGNIYFQVNKTSELFEINLKNENFEIISKDNLNE